MHSSFDSKVSTQTGFMNFMIFFFNFINQALNRIVTKAGIVVGCC